MYEGNRTVKTSSCRWSALVSLSALAAVVSPACFVDNPDQLAPTSDAGLSYADAEAVVDAGSDAMPAQTLCLKYGGYPTVEVIIGNLFKSLVADCRISKFFTTLTTERQGHLYDCLVDQVAVVLGCPGIKYDVDNQGVDCRDMRTAHHGLAIRGDDFDALVEDLVTVLQDLQVDPNDIAALAPTLESLRSDIVTNSAPGSAKPICDGDAGP